MANKYMKKCSISLAKKEMQIKMKQIPSHPNQDGHHQENKQQTMARRVKKPLYTAEGNVN
jgi:hypothetical protein